MARKKQGEGPSLSRDKLRALWDKCPPSAVQDIFQIYRPAKSINRNGNILKASCIFHEPDNHPSFIVNYNQRYAKCFSCGAFTNDLVKIVSQIKNKSYAETAKDMVSKYMPKLLTEGQLKHIQKEQDAFYVHSLFNKLCKEALVNAVDIFEKYETEFTEFIIKQNSEQIRGLEVEENQDPLDAIQEQIRRAQEDLKCVTTQSEQSKLVIDGTKSDDFKVIEKYQFAAQAVNYLVNVRKITLYPEIQPVGIFPPEHLIDELLTITEEDKLKLISFLEAQGLRENKFVGQLVFTYWYNLDQIGSFKLRFIQNEWYQSTESEDRIHKQVRFYQHSDLKGSNKITENPSLFYDPNYYRDDLGKTKDVYVVEGEFDYLAITSRQLTYNLPKAFFLALGGSGGLNVSSFSESFNIDRLFIVTDIPDAHGDKLAYSIIKKKNGMIQPFVYKWDNCPGHIKDPDDLMKYSEFNNTIREVYHHLLSVENYENEEVYACNHIEKILKSLDIKESLTEKVKIYTTLQQIDAFEDPILQRTIAAKMSTRLNIDPELMTHKISTNNMSQDEFLKRFRHLFQAKFCVMGAAINNNASDRELIIWDKENRSEFRVSSSRLKEAQTVLASKIGSCYAFVKENLSVPPFILLNETGAERRIPDVEKTIKDYMGVILNDMTMGTHVLDEQNQKRGGNFYDDESERWYVHNGHHIFVGNFDDEDNLHYTRSDVPCVDGHYFRVPKKHNDNTSVIWSKWAVSEKNMNDPSLLSFGEIYTKLLEVVSHCFKFKNEAHYHIAVTYMMYVAFYRLFGRNIYLFLSGETSSGKSKFAFGFLGGKEDERLNLVEAVLQNTVYTEASIRQTSNNKGLALTLDEFEDSNQNDTKSICVKQLLNVWRTGANKQVISRGTPSGEAKEFVFDSTVLAVAIRPPNDPIDYNRFLFLFTKKLQGVPHPYVLLMEIMKNEENIAKLRNSITVVPQRYTRPIQRAIQDINMYIKSQKEIYESIPERTLSQLIPLAAIEACAKAEVRLAKNYPSGIVPKKDIKIDEEDVRFFFSLYIKDNTEIIEKTKNMGHTNDLWTSLLHASAFERNYQPDTVGFREKLPLIDVLQNNELRQELIDKVVHGCQLYITDDFEIQDRRYLLITYWNEAKCIFDSRSEFRRYQPQKLQSVADRDNDVIPHNEIKFVIPKWNEVFKRDLDLSVISIKDVTALVSPNMRPNTTKSNDDAEALVADSFI